MSRARLRALVLFLGVVTGITLLVLVLLQARSEGPQVRPREQRPVLLLLTSLPLLFGDGFSLNAKGAPALKRLRTRYRVVPISVTAPLELTKGRLLLMAQPQAQTAENLVALDDWVRGGGRVLLMADPLLEWPSPLPLGDITRPPAIFMDTGLLLHWGLRLEAPAMPALVGRRLGGYDITTLAPGALRGQCEISPDRLVAHCRIGAGAVTVVADADLLNVEELGPRSRHNLDGLLGELAILERT